MSQAGDEEAPVPEGEPLMSQAGGEEEPLMSPVDREEAPVPEGEPLMSPSGGEEPREGSDDMEVDEEKADEEEADEEEAEEAGDSKMAEAELRETGADSRGLASVDNGMDEARGGFGPPKLSIFLLAKCSRERLSSCALPA
jgi:hypothetical protein